MSVEPAVEEQFGPYRVYERLGVGGMATVHRAIEHADHGIERVVALKRLLPHLAEDASFIKAFVREAKLASLLNHLNIVKIYELGRVGTEYFISMEYIEGRDLRRVLRHARKVTGPPPIDVTVGLMIQLCDALDYAHRKLDDDGLPLRIVHRDISPSNLIVTRGGHIKIIDFGIAKAQSSQLRTHTGRVKGKLAYLAPEAVASGTDLDARSDIWATGVILHELCTARPLFATKNEYETLLKVQRGDIVPPSRFNQACPPELDAIVLRALARDPAERFATAGELRAELAGLAKRRSLRTGFRDVAGWIEWAFGIEAPAGSASAASGATSTSPSGHTRSPRPARDQELDDAVEVVWGSGSLESEDGPVVLEDVPDVSDKHRTRRDTEDDSLEADDIPTPLPSHGTMPSIYGEAPAIEVVAQRDVQREQRPTAPGAAPPRDSEPPVAIPSPAEQFGDDAAAVLASISAQIEMAATQSTMPEFSDDIKTSPKLALAETSPDVPHARFSTTAPSPIADTGAKADSARSPIADTGVKADPVRSPIVATKPGVGPASQPARPSRPAVERDPDRPPAYLDREPVRPIAPSRRTTLLFVVAGLLIAGGTAALVVLSMSGDDDAAPMPAPAPAPPRAAEPAPPPPVVASKVKFVLEPADAEIKIEGKTVHGGSPWATELPAGSYQIEILRESYKSWLTSLELSPNESASLHVVLKPLTSAIAGDATVIVSTTPAGLDVYIDGKRFGRKTPIRTTLSVGPHEIAVRQHGTVVWRQHVDAEASSDYEFNPSFTDEKKRERAERSATPKPAPVPAAPAAPTPSPATTPPPAAPAAPTPAPPARDAPAPSATTPGTARSSAETPVVRRVDLPPLERP